MDDTAAPWRRVGAVGAALAGLVWIVSGVLAVIYRGEHAPGTPEDFLVEGTFAAGVAFTALGMAGLHAVQRGRAGAIERPAFLLVVVASLAQAAATVAALAGVRQFEWVVFPVGVVAVLIGFVLYGVATLRAKILPRWIGIGLIAGLPVAIVLGMLGGNVLFGLLWLGVAFVLRREPSAI